MYYQDGQQLCLFLSYEIQGQKQLQHFLLKLFFLIGTALSTKINSFIQQIVLRDSALTWKQIRFSLDVHFNYGNTWISFWLQNDQNFSFSEPLNIVPNTKIPKFQVFIESVMVSLLHNPKPNTLNPNWIHLESFWKANSPVSLGKVPGSHAEFFFSGCGFLKHNISFGERVASLHWDETPCCCLFSRTLHSVLQGIGYVSGWATCWADIWGKPFQAGRMAWAKAWSWTQARPVGQPVASPSWLERAIFCGGRSSNQKRRGRIRTVAKPRTCKATGGGQPGKLLSCPGIHGKWESPAHPPPRTPATHTHRDRHFSALLGGCTVMWTQDGHVFQFSKTREMF